MRPKDGRLWPTTADTVPHEARFWVANSSLLSNDARQGVSSFLVTESPDQIIDRLSSQFPLFRMARFVGIGRNIVNNA